MTLIEVIQDTSFILSHIYSPVPYNIFYVKSKVTNVQCTPLSFISQDANTLQSPPSTIDLASTPVRQKVNAMDSNLSAAA